MADNVLAYIGIENYDVIIYQAMILARIKKKVLIIDRSAAGSLSYAFPKLQGLDIEKGTITYRHVDMAKMPLSRMLLADYDDVLVSYGFTEVGDEAQYITRYIFVTDMFVHNVERIKQIEKGYEGAKSLLLREALAIKITPGIVFEAFEADIPRSLMDYVEFFENDYENAVTCQYSRSYRFVHISKELKTYLLREITRLYPNISANALAAGYKKARKGD